MTHPLDALGLPSQILLWQFVFLVAFSFAVGLLGGFVGLALGTIRLTVLLLLGVPVSIAAGTNILVSTLSSLTGSIRHFIEGNVNIGVVVSMGFTSVIGAFVGGLVSEFISDGLIIALVGVLVLWQGIQLIGRKAEARGSSLGEGGGPGSRAGNSFYNGMPDRMFSRSRVAASAGIGLGVGLVGGCVGLILGTVRLPAIIRVLQVEPRVAAGTNMLIGFWMGMFGWFGHAVMGNVDYPLLVGMGLTGMLGAYYGARLTGRVGIQTLIRTTGWVLLLVGAIMILGSYRRLIG